MGKETKKDIIIREILKSPGYILAAGVGVIIAGPIFGYWYYKNKIEKKEKKENSDE